MSVELYPNIEDLDERLSALEDPELAERILSANPRLFTSAAAQEEVSIFAMAWKRFGALALAVSAALAVGAGFAFTPHTAARPALKPIAAPVAVSETSRIAVPKITKLVVSPPRQHAAASAAAAPAAVTVPVAAPIHHTVAYHHAATAAASHVSAPSARAVAAPAAASNAAPQAEAPIQYEANAKVVSSTGIPQDSAPPPYSKGGVVGDNQDAPMPLILDSCTPPGGRTAYLIKN